MDEYKAGVVVPTLNGGDLWRKCVYALAEQSFKPKLVLVIDSSSTDGTIVIAEASGFEVKSIPRSEFNHGGTRQQGVEIVEARGCEFVVFLTQDAILADREALGTLLSAFADESVGAAYGRQLPAPMARPIGAHARIFNYPAREAVYEAKDAKGIGVKAAFFSNSFGAYRISALKQVGGFPRETIMNEDTYVVAKMLLAGWRNRYVGNAKVYHSHDYTYTEDFRRAFDIGVFHGKESWLRADFGAAEGEGLRYVLSEAQYLWKHAAAYIPSAFVRNFVKLLGYRLGIMEAWLPRSWKEHMSMNSGFWRK